MENLRLKVLEQRGIKPTAIRMLVLKAMIDTGQVVSLPDLGDKLDTMDRSSIFRMITLFVSQHLAHSIDGDTGSLKYAVCNSECTCAVKDLHTHFCCGYYYRTFYLENVHVPVVDLPEGFAVRSIDYVLKGCYAECVTELRKGH